MRESFRKHACRISSKLTLKLTLLIARFFGARSHEHYIEFNSYRFVDSRDFDTHDSSPIEYDCCDLFDCGRLNRIIRYWTLLALNSPCGKNSQCVDLIVDRRFTASFIFAVIFFKNYLIRKVRQRTD
jgi:hypothetical protein